MSDEPLNHDQGLLEYSSGSLSCLGMLGPVKLACAPLEMYRSYCKSEATSALFDSARLTTLMYVKDEYGISVS